MAGTDKFVYKKSKKSVAMYIVNDQLCKVFLKLDNYEIF